jgi:hypothetical protein
VKPPDALSTSSLVKRTRSSSEFFGYGPMAWTRPQPRIIESKRREHPIPTGATRLTERLESTLKNPASSSDFDLLANTNEVLSNVGLTAADSGGRLSFYGLDPIIPSPHRFGAMAAIGLAAKSVAAAALWRARTGEGQDIHVDVRKALRRFCGFFEGKWETMNGRPPAMGGFAGNPFLELPILHKTRDGRYVVALDFYPRSKTDTLKFLRCTDSIGSIENAILQRRADDLEESTAEEGLILAKVRTTEEARKVRPLSCLSWVAAPFANLSRHTGPL